MAHPSFGQGADPSRLRFNSSNDALHYADHIVQEANNRALRKWPDIIQVYDEGNCHVAVRCRLRNKTEFDVMFSAVPFQARPKRSRPTSSDDKVISSELRRRDNAVFISDGYLVNSPEKVIPSFVWIEPTQKRDDIWMKMLALSPDHVFKASLRGRKWEIGIFGFSGSRQRPRRGVRGLIKRSPQIVAGIRGHISKSLRQFLHSEFVPYISTYKLWLNRNGVWLFLDPKPDCPIKIMNVFLCTPNTVLGVGK